jgi:predicted molibdopterin-dependent oxidoreductase YjgC
VPASVRALVTLGAEPGLDPGKLREVAIIAMSTHEAGLARAALIALPVAAWAEAAGTATNDKGHVQRMHAAFAPPGHALPAWEVIVRLAQATAHGASSQLRFAHAREVFKDMTQTVPAFRALTWAREARPLALRFADSRG